MTKIALVRILQEQPKTPKKVLGSNSCEGGFSVYLELIAVDECLERN
jgi:hypothetical protein